MHYRNGREAKNGDRVIFVNPYGEPVIGILCDATAGNDHCNGKLAPVSALDEGIGLKHCLHWDIDLKRCLHWDDVKEILNH